MIEKDKRNASDKIKLFREFFTGLDHVYGTFDPQSGQSWQVKKPVTDQVILRHLTGRRPYGVYLLVGDQTRAVIVDFDHDDAMPPLDFVAAATHYDIPAYIERSKSKGYHVWVFFEQAGVIAAKARTVMRHILSEVDSPNTEVFPKQDALDQLSTGYGNFINAPLFGKLVPKERMVFVNPHASMRPYPNQWAFLDTIQRVQEKMLDDIIEINELGPGSGLDTATPVNLGMFESAQALPPCAQKMLQEGVSENQRVSCFRLAVHLRKVGLPFEIVVAALSEWAGKNHPANGKRIITPTEIKAQTAAAFLKEYRGYGCEEPAVAPFCDSSCPIRGNSRSSRDMSASQ